MISLGQLMQQYVDTRKLNTLEGIHQTEIPGVLFYRSSKGNSRQPFVYQSGIVILGQGHKNIHIGSTPVAYGPEDYLVVGVPMPLECEALPEEGKPMLGLTVNIDSAMLHKLVTRLEQLQYSHENRHTNNHHADTPHAKSTPSNACGLKSVKMNPCMLDTCKRIMVALCDDIEAQVIGLSLLEELVYRALTSEEGHVLFDLAHHEGPYARVAKALNKVHQTYHEPLTVQSLAEEANMSVSAFHQAFRNVTLESPLQYIKKVRLNKAKELIQSEGKRISDAARLVGYSSSSQFSREYKRHFNETPKSARH
ncbi:AraC family transcriptional regulator N-terminal domain-containing protein [Vibrio tapetis subsp. quintayensis]|uniref:AraC family transcriptional regulator n=1 Tax=Vibrio tapetis TaxID=52443 RepID=UPI0025B56CA9|nr:AraC family transcriptional regulator N-terminal domain-containing protein [Vibrio tapetis]MDN3682851.1 AraC family transcriptional regulator N-terminal domain-containing protein [Vibrio tapetis subsp. quintayensis]